MGFGGPYGPRIKMHRSMLLVVTIAMGLNIPWPRDYGLGALSQDDSPWQPETLRGVPIYSIYMFGLMYFQLLGCAILGIGIWLHIAKGSYADLAPSFKFLSATSLCIAAGAIVLVVGFFGCCGAIMENQCMLLTVSIPGLYI